MRRLKNMRNQGQIIDFFQWQEIEGKNEARVRGKAPLDPHRVYKIRTLVNRLFG